MKRPVRSYFAPDLERFARPTSPLAGEDRSARRGAAEPLGDLGEGVA